MTNICDILGTLKIYFIKVNLLKNIFSKINIVWNIINFEGFL